MEKILNVPKMIIKNAFEERRRYGNLIFCL